MEQKLNQIPVDKILKHKTLVKGNNAFLLNYALLLNNHNFDYFFISTNGIDRLGIDFLKELPKSFLCLNKKLFIIGAKRHALNFEIKNWIHNEK